MRLQRQRDGKSATCAYTVASAKLDTSKTKPKKVTSTHAKDAPWRCLAPGCGAGAGNGDRGKTNFKSAADLAAHYRKAHCGAITEEMFNDLGYVRCPDCNLPFASGTHKCTGIKDKPYKKPRTKYLTSLRRRRPNSQWTLVAQ